MLDALVVENVRTSAIVGESADEVSLGIKELLGDVCVGHEAGVMMTSRSPSSVSVPTFPASKEYIPAEK